MKTKTTKTRIFKILAALTVSLAVFTILPTQTAAAQTSPGGTAISCPLEQQEVVQLQDGRHACTAYSQSGCARGQNKVTPTLQEDLDLLEHNFACIPIAAAEMDEDAQKDLRMIGMIQDMTNLLLWPLLVLTGDLMDSSMIFGAGMEEVLRSIWIQIRNLVNILFVLILVGIALYNVLGVGDENSEYAIKNMLPKLIIAIIAVNFSFLAMKVLLDTVNVLTVAIFSLPDQARDGTDIVVEVDDEGKIPKERVRSILPLCAAEIRLTPTEYESLDIELLKDARKERALRIAMREIADADTAMDLASLEEIKGAQENTNEIQTKREEVEKAFLCAAPTGGALTERVRLSEKGMQFLRRYNKQNMAMAMALNMGNIQFFRQPAIDSWTFENIRHLLINTLLSMVFYLVFAISFIALAAVLLVRMVVMWLSVALSPILILLMGASGIKEKLPGSISELTSQFTKSLIAPIMVALPMTIGWIMLSAIGGADFITGERTMAASGGFVAGIPVAGLDDLQQLMVGVGTIAVVWMGVFAAASDTPASFITDKIKGWAEMTGKYVGALPLRTIPIVPAKDGETKTIGQVIRGMEGKMADPLTGRDDRGTGTVRDLRRVDRTGTNFLALFAGLNETERKRVSAIQKEIAGYSEDHARRIRAQLVRQGGEYAGVWFDNIRANRQTARSVQALLRIADRHAESKSPTEEESDRTGRTESKTVRIGNRRNISVSSDTQETYNTQVRALRGATEAGTASAALRELAQLRDGNGNYLIRPEHAADDLQAILGDKYGELVGTDKPLGEEIGLSGAITDARTSP